MLVIAYSSQQEQYSTSACNPHIISRGTESTLWGGLYHEAGEGWQNIDRRIDLPVVQLPVHVHLPFCDVAGEVWNGVSDVIVGHRQDGQLSDGALAPLNPPSALVDGGQVSVHVTWTPACPSISITPLPI